MKIKPNPFLGSWVFAVFFFVVRSDDTAVMNTLRENIKAETALGWTDSDPCNWAGVGCSTNNRVTRIQIGNKDLRGTLPASLKDLDSLQRLEVQSNQLTGPVPSLAGLNQLQIVLLGNNNFSSFPADFFSGMSSLQAVSLDYNPFAAWSIPVTLADATTLQNFSATSANVTGKIPDLFDSLVGMVGLHLSFNYIEGPLPATFSASPIQSLWLNGQLSDSKLNGSIRVLQNMTSLKVAWLHSNSFSGSLPDLSALNSLEQLSLRDNKLTGIVPPSLTGLSSLKVLNLTNNRLQGPTPKFHKSVALDMAGTNSFCLPDPGVGCDSRVDTMLAIAGSVGYPLELAENWEGNDPCSSWLGITCQGSQVVVVNFQKMGLTGTISSNFSSLTSLQKLILANNNLTGTIPTELTTLSQLKELDISNNQIHGVVPEFKSSVNMKTSGNPDIGKNSSTAPSPGDTNNITTPTPKVAPGPESGSSVGSVKKVIMGSVAGVCAILGCGMVGAGLYCKRKKHPKAKGKGMTIHPQHWGSSQDAVKLSIANSNINGKAFARGYSQSSSGSADINVMEPGNMVTSIHILQAVTNNFSEANVLGRGGFGTVYKGVLLDGTKIAVKRMESGTLTEKGLAEFKSEIEVLTQVRHRHLVALLGYCLDGNERLLVYQYMPQGTLSEHLFNWQERGLKPLGWTRRLGIALDVARGVEYLHSLAHQSFIHRDLKPSNILLGDDMRAKVSDFGLVRLAPEGNKASVETRLAGTFGYLAPEYAATGRVTTKVDVFSFGVILMELITGRKALDESRPEDCMHLVTWFNRMKLNRDTFGKAVVDPMMDVDEGGGDALVGIGTVAELAGHCTAREPYQRPNMGHAVHVLSSLVELWKPAVELQQRGTTADDQMYEKGLHLSLPQALKKWQSIDSSLSGSSIYTTQSSIPSGPTDRKSVV